jgi:homoserine O-acetyltransferase/O-succinyltransferase
MRTGPGHSRVGLLAAPIAVTEKFGLTSFALIVGGSMGAQQTYQWAVRCSEMFKRAAPIAGTARNTIHDFLFTETLVEAITSDPGFNRGFYASSADVREGLLRHSKLWAALTRPFPRSGTDGLQTLCWREMDSNF